MEVKWQKPCFMRGDPWTNLGQNWELSQYQLFSGSMLCLLVYYWQDGEKGYEYTQLSEVAEATFLGPGFRTRRHMGAWVVSYCYPLWGFGRDPLPSPTVKTTCAWIPMPGKLPVRHPCASRAGLPRLLSQTRVPYITPDPLAALESCWKSCKISIAVSARANISAVTL